MPVKTYAGSCHCKAVRFEADIDLSKGTMRCNCSLCAKVRSWFALVPTDALRLTKGAEKLSEYAWVPPNRPHANLHYAFCGTCGVRAFARGEDDGKGNGFYAIAVATLDDADPQELASSIVYVDGKHDRYDRPPLDPRVV